MWIDAHLACDLNAMFLPYLDRECRAVYMQWHLGCLDSSPEETEMGLMKWRHKLSWLFDRDVFGTSHCLRDDAKEHYHVVLNGELRIWENWTSSSKRIQGCIEPSPNRYLRFGHLPKNMLSFNHRQEFFEKGLSVYETCISNGLLVPIVFADDGGSTAGICDPGRAVYELTGDVIGTGSDGEPLLCNVEVVGVCQLIQKDGIVVGWQTYPGLITQLKEWYR